jgi:hypothetical protein
MTLVLVVIALELGALLYIAHRVWNLLETNIWDNTATIDGNMMDATRALIDSEKWLRDVRDTIVANRRDRSATKPVGNDAMTDTAATPTVQSIR